MSRDQILANITPAQVLEAIAWSENERRRLEESNLDIAIRNEELEKLNSSLRERNFDLSNRLEAECERYRNLSVRHIELQEALRQKV